MHSTWTRILFWSLTLLIDSKYSGELVKAVRAASWKGAGAESVILTWIFLIADAINAGAVAHPTLQPVRWQTSNEIISFILPKMRKFKTENNSTTVWFNAALTCNTICFRQRRSYKSPLLHPCKWGKGDMLFTVICYMLVYLHNTQANIM